MKPEIHAAEALALLRRARYSVLTRASARYPFHADSSRFAVVSVTPEAREEARTLLADIDTALGLEPIRSWT